MIDPADPTTAPERGPDPGARTPADPAPADPRPLDTQDAGWARRLRVTGETAAVGTQIGNRYVLVGGREMHYRRTTGAAPPNARPIVLVHGVVSGRYFLPLAERLAPHYRVMVPDLPGVGSSFRAPEPLDVGGLAEWLARWMRACGMQRAHLVGQSFGCNIVAEAVARHPELAATVTLQGVMLAPQLRSRRKLLLQWLRSALREIPPPRHVLPALREVSYDQRLAMLRSMLEHRIEDRLPTIACPALVLQAGRDPLVPQGWAEQVAQLLPDARLHTDEQATHTMPSSAPARFAEALLRFLDDQPAPDPAAA